MDPNSNRDDSPAAVVTRPPASPPHTDHGEVSVDSEDDELEAETPLSELEAELSSEVLVEPLTLPVPRRTNYKATFLPKIDSNRQLQKWRKQSHNRKLPDQIDVVAFASRVLAHTNTGIVRRNVPVTIEGEPMTFRSSQFLAIYKATGVLEAVRKFYGRDGDIISIAEEIVQEAGYAGEIEEGSGDDEDPTLAPAPPVAQ